MKIKTQIFMNKAVYLGLSILEISIIVMYDLWYDYVKPKYGEKAKLCHMDTDSFIVYIIHKNRGHICRHYKRCWNKRNKIWFFKIWVRWPFPKGKNKKVIGLMKEEVGGKRMKEFAVLRAK